MRESHVEARRLGHGFVGDVHLLLALVRPGETSVAAAALRACGVDYGALSAFAESVAATDASFEQGIRPNPHWYRLVGRAEGIAVGLGAGEVLPEHTLLALVWEQESAALLAGAGTTREAVYDSLREHWADLPGGELPPSRPLPSGPPQRAYFPRERLREVLDKVPPLLPPDSHWGFNYEGPYRAWISAYGEFDLDALVGEALA